MKYGILFTILALLFAVHAFVYGGTALVLLWPALSFFLVSFAYFSGSVAVFGKRPDGSMDVRSLFGLLPYLACLWGLWHLLRLLEREPPYHELTPGVLIGRRLLASELPAGVSLVVDLTCEFPEPVAIRSACAYRAFPILDGAAGAGVVELARHIKQHQGTVYIHCAEGHGRTGMVAAVLLLEMYKASSASQAIARVRQQRPRVRLSPPQRRIVETTAAVMQMRIRPVNAEDAEPWLTMRLALWPETDQAQHRKEMAMMCSDPARYAVFVCADGGGVPRGFAEVSLREWAEGCLSSPVGYLEGWFVAGPARGQGVGKKLLAAAEDWARSRGCTEMASDTDLTNKNSTAAHLKAGYHIAARVVAFRKDLGV